VRFTKMHALGNDFVAVNGFERLPVAERDFPALAIQMCDRHTGIGADGLFVAAPSETHDARMLFYNPDGTEDRCGNGLRCFGRFLHDEGITTKRDLVVDAFGWPMSLRVDSHRGRVGDVRVDLGAPVLDPDRIPLAVPSAPPGHGPLGIPLETGGHTFHADVVSTGTPHAIINVDEMPDEASFQSFSPALEIHPAFPEKANILWTRYLADDLAEIRIWERAVGETLGCGTGAAAVAVVARLRGISGGPVCVRSRGGSVWAAWDGADSVTLTGPAFTVFTGRWTGALPGAGPAG